VRSVLILCLVFWLGISKGAFADRVTFSDNELKVDGIAVPYLFGGETQYFRARGGSGKNVDRKVVIALWNKLLDRVKEAHMNIVSLYIPWDFHEPTEGVFDFTGTLDQDGDGKADYPSRDLITFLHLVEQHGIRYAMLRPGPYINAEWGPVGFGAVPLWFLNNYPKSLAVTQDPNRAKTAAFYDPVYQEHVRKWFRALYSNVLKDFVGPKKLGVFVQLDNETNYFWDSIYQRDYSDASIARYRDWLSQKYESVSRVNDVYGSTVTSFTNIAPPKSKNDPKYPKPQWQYDWFHFHDVEIRTYYQFLRQAWNEAGLPASQVLFTSCDSFNAADSGLLPRLDYRERDRLSLTTMNIYPKTDGTQAFPSLENPMKAAHDAVTISSAHDQFWGALGGWLMTTETVGGWFPPVKITLSTRQHTYGSLFGSGVKAQDIYYFHEGYNWSGLEQNDTELHFDAPLDKDMNPNPNGSFDLLVNMGQVLQEGLGQRLMATENYTSPVLITHDNDAQYPIPGNTDALNNASNDSAALFGAFREAGALPNVRYIDAMDLSELIRNYRLIAYSSPGYLTPSTREKLVGFLKNGGTVALFGGPDPKMKSYPGLKYFPTNPVSSWNTPQYVSSPDPISALQTIKGLLQTAGVVPPMSVTTHDPRPYVHVWIRSARDGGSSLLFVENFLNKPRQISISFAGMAEKTPSTFRLIHRWGPNGNFSDVEASVKEGAELPVSSDGVDVWELTNTIGK
jgi:hypothetical protein